VQSRMKKSRHNATKYKVLVAVECIKEYKVVARDKEEASAFAEARAMKNNNSLAVKGYVVGDVETALVEELKK